MAHFEHLQIYNSTMKLVAHLENVVRGFHRYNVCLSEVIMNSRKLLFIALLCFTIHSSLFNLVSAATFAPLPKTGQTTSYVAGDDGALQNGVAWQNPRFSDNGDGTVSDNQTGLIWLKNANCYGTKTWATAITSANTLASGSCGLTDGSISGQWRLPNIYELESLVDLSKNYPALPAGHPFSNVQLGDYWSSTTGSGSTITAWFVSMYEGKMRFYGDKTYAGYFYVWPVRGGQWLFDSLVIKNLLQYGNKWLNNSSVKEIVIRNGDSVASKIFSVSITGTNASEFSVTPGGSNSCGSLTPTLSAGASCTMQVTANLTSAGAKSASLNIATSAGSKGFPITATGSAPPSVTFNSNGGSAVTSQSVPYNTVASAPTAPTKIGYTFVG